ncbi:hypothetical protein EVG20_g8596 [Dentipellis fragilis]|uniref:Uncharacterized protein n=1 Tax=Dentipellis fragilis TaxID=205917 RepID=A0A4Y9Y6A2_9AGAM|nr:hypothetical protein EVG20_g8596 [Dentipellis fragilis]
MRLALTGSRCRVSVAHDETTPARGRVRCASCTATAVTPWRALLLLPAAARSTRASSSMHRVVVCARVRAVVRVRRHRPVDVDVNVSVEFGSDAHYSYAALGSAEAIDRIGTSHLGYSADPDAAIIIMHDRDVSESESDTPVEVLPAI